MEGSPGGADLEPYLEYDRCPRLSPRRIKGRHVVTFFRVVEKPQHQKEGSQEIAEGPEEYAVSEEQADGVREPGPGYLPEQEAGVGIALGNSPARDAGNEHYETDGENKKAGRKGDKARPRVMERAEVRPQRKSR